MKNIPNLTTKIITKSYNFELFHFNREISKCQWLLILILLITNYFYCENIIIKYFLLREVNIMCHVLKNKFTYKG